LSSARTNAARVGRRKWPGPTVEVLTGAMTVERVGDITMSAEGEKTRRERGAGIRTARRRLSLGLRSGEIPRRL
jgi:hypothetical protein